MSSSASNEELLAKVEEYLLGDEAFATEFEKFAQAHCSIFEDTEENKLDYMNIYQQFTDLFNQRVEAFIQKAGSTPEKFVSVVESAPSDTFVTQMILSITSFDQFKRMMLDEKKRKKSKSMQSNTGNRRVGARIESGRRWERNADCRSTIVLDRNRNLELDSIDCSSSFRDRCPNPLR